VIQFYKIPKKISFGGNFLKRLKMISLN